MSVVPSASPAWLRFGNGWQPAVLLVLVALLVSRAPLVLMEPRLWAEECDMFLAHALQLDFWQFMLDMPSQRSGSISLVPTLAFAAGAALPDVAYAPVPPLLAALALMLAIFAHILWGPSLLFRTPALRMLGCAIVLFVPNGVASGETWLNAMNTMTYCGVIALLLLLEDTRSATRAVAVYRALLLVVAGLTGVYAAVLAAAFCLKWWFERSPQARRDLVVMASCLVLQLAAFAWFKSSGAMMDHKLEGEGLAKSIVGVVEYQVLLPILGLDVGLRAITALGLPVTEMRGFPWRTPAGVWVSLVAIVVAVPLLLTALGRRPVPVALLIAGSLATWMVLTGLFSVDAVPRRRYAVAPSIALGMLLLHAAAAPGRAAVVRWIAGVLLATSLLKGVPEFYRTSPMFTGRDGYGVAWREEVARWRADPDTLLRAWPAGVAETYLPQPEMLRALKRAMQQLPGRRLSRTEPLVVAVDGLPAVFGLELSMQMARGADAGLQISLRDAEARLMLRAAAQPQRLPDGSLTLRLDSIALRGGGFSKFSQVRRMEFAPAEGAEIEVLQTRYYSPLMKWDHPYSGK